MLARLRNLKFYEVFPAAFVGFLFLLNLLPLLAPILAYFGEKNISGFIYWLYSFSCHQKASRSFFVCDHQYGWCARCTFLWFSTFLSSIIVFYGHKFIKIPGLSWQTALVFVAPMAFDGGIQLIASVVSLFTGLDPFYESTNSIRAITGSFFGIGLGLYLFPRLKAELGYNSQLDKTI
jgi:uncharacterized membrane protein